MAKGAVTGDISEWENVNIDLVRAAFRRGVRTGAASSGSCDEATLSALKKFISADAYKNIQTGAFSGAAVKNKLPLGKFVTKDFFMKMAGNRGSEEKTKAAAIAMAQKIAETEQACQEKDAKEPKKDTGVTGRLTDTSKYTGSHKERFDEKGTGKGKSGRVDECKNSGYVGNYKGEGTYKGDK